MRSEEPPPPLQEAPFRASAWEARFFESREAALALLSLLEERPKHGYELMKELGTRAGGTYRASAGAIVPKLQQLQDEGLLPSISEDGGRRIDSLTEEGRAVAEREPDAIARIWRRAERGGRGDGPDPGAAELVRPAFRPMKASLRVAARGGGD